MKSDDTRIEALEALVAAQGAEIADLRSRLPAPRVVRAPNDDGLRITYPPARSSFVAPSEEELRQLYAAVFARYPNLEPDFAGKFADSDLENHFRSFRCAFTRLGLLRRAAALDSKHHISFWIDEADEWLRRHYNGGRAGEGFMIAIIAHNDIPYTLPDAFGNVAEVGLTLGKGKPATDAWRRVLTGKILAPTPGKYGAARS